MLGLISSLVLVVGIACFSTDFALHMVRENGYPNNQEWHHVLVNAHLEVIILTAIVVSLWLCMIRSGRFAAQLWGWVMALAWGFPFIPYIAITSIGSIFGFSVNTPTCLFLLVAVSQVWVAWKACKLSTPKTPKSIVEN